jgi:hypothetical protein
MVKHRMAQHYKLRAEILTKNQDYVPNPAPPQNPRDHTDYHFRGK